MFLTSQRMLSDSPSVFSLTTLYFSRNSSISLSIAVRQHLSNPEHLRILKLRSLGPDKFNSFRTHADPFHIGVYETEGPVQKAVVGDFNLDSLLSFAELSCLLSSAILSVGFAVISVIARSKKEVTIRNWAILWGMLMLVGGVLRFRRDQLEKLGIRFRVTRKALKEPITEVNIAFSCFVFPLARLILGSDSRPCILIYNNMLICRR